MVKVEKEEVHLEVTLRATESTTSAECAIEQKDKARTDTHITKQKVVEREEIIETVEKKELGVEQVQLDILLKTPEQTATAAVSIIQILKEKASLLVTTGKKTS